MNIKKVLDISCYIITPVILVASSIFFASRETFNYFGWIATYLLIFILFIKPLGVIFDIAWMRRWVGFRRQLGVAIFWFALFHSVMFVYDYELYDITLYFGWNNYLFYGLIAMIGMFILGITSNTWSARKMRKNWKKVQYITYPVFALTIVHIGIVRGEMVFAGSVIMIYCVLKVLEFRGVKLLKDV